MLTFEQLVRVRTKEDIRAQLLDGLKGLGFVRHDGIGPGTVKLSGVPSVTASVVVEIVATGVLGAATFRYSSDGGQTFTAPLTIPAGGTFVLPGTGVSLTFAAGPAGSGDPFLAGDRYAFELSTPNFPVTSWQPGSTPLTQVEVFSEAMEDFSGVQREIAAGGLLRYSKGDWLTLLGKQVYGLDRKPGTRARGTVILTDAANAGPFPISAGQLWAVSTSGRRFTNITGGTLTLGGTLQLTFEAESPGADFNVANGSIQTLATPLPGVTVSNPNPGSGTWLTVQGTNAETDAELQARCERRWPALGIGATGEGYEQWAREASAAVKQVNVRTSTTVPGQVEVFLAGASGASDPATVAAVDAYIQKRVPTSSSALVQAATNVPVTVQATAYVEAAFLASAQAEAAANVEKLITETGIAGTLYRSALIEQLMLPAGMRNVVLSLPAADVVLGEHQVATLTLNLTWVAV